GPAIDVANDLHLGSGRGGKVAADVPATLPGPVRRLHGVRDALEAEARCRDERERDGLPDLEPERPDAGLVALPEGPLAYVPDGLVEVRRRGAAVAAQGRVPARLPDGLLDPDGLAHVLGGVLEVAVGPLAGGGDAEGSDVAGRSAAGEDAAVR